jgi:hypothetical protein
MRLGIGLQAAGLGFLLAAVPGLRAEETNQAPDFQEVYGLVQAHLAGMSEAELNRAAVEGLISALNPRVSLVTKDLPASGRPERPLVRKSSLFENDIAYVRVGRVEDGLAKAVREACQRLGVTNKLKGVVLDLRFTGGENYAAAAGVAELFIKKEQPLLDWGNGMVRSKPGDDAIAVPVAVLVNHQTARAAEALAAVLREAGAALLLGSKTAGQAMIAQEFPLKNGGRLRLATTPIQLGDGSPMALQGLKPDIAVEVNPQDERAYYGDAFRETPRSNLVASATPALTNQPAGTNHTARRARFNEAELVRERREGTLPDDEVAPEGETEPEPPVVRDPALARALDVLKGLALVRQSRS